MRDIFKKIYHQTPYAIMIVVYLVFILFAFLLDTPSEIYHGLIRIITSKSILITDYVELGGIGATLINAVLVGAVSICVLVRSGIKPNGAIIMALWMTTGFSLFGKNLFNMWPITLGVWLFSRYQKEPFKNYALAALLCATLSPSVSELSFMGLPLGILWGILLGVFVGFIFPAVSASAVKAHGGYCLYNMGFAGGLIATFVASVMRSLGIQIETANIWNREYGLELAVFLYVVSTMLALSGALLSKTNAIQDVETMMGHSGRMVTDLYFLYKESVFVNMGLLCALGTTVVLAVGGNLNGPTLGGIFTITGFGAFGKHLRNVPPILIGAIASTYFNTWDPTSPSNTLAILFSTGLAPIAGQFGWLWGIVAGFIHVNIATNVGALNAGLNLYNNGFAAGLVAMVLVPVITSLKREREEL